MNQWTIALASSVALPVGVVVLLQVGRRAGQARIARDPEVSWLHVALFALVMSATVYVTMDLEYPRVGLIRVDAVDRVLVELRWAMG